MDNTEKGFSYTYSAKEQAEVERIQKKYLPKQEDKLTQLRELDRIPNKKACVWALSFGILGALVMGLGMSFCMTDLGDILGAYWNGYSIALLIGIPLGLLGVVLAALAYPVYNRILKKQRAKLAPRILQLTEELLK